MNRAGHRRRFHVGWDGGAADEGKLLGVEAAGAAVLRLTGEIDLSSTSVLASIIRAHQEDLRMLDLRQVSFIDCQGLAVLLDATRRARRAGLRLSILPCEGLRRLVCLLGMQDALDIAAAPQARVGAR